MTLDVILWMAALFLAGVAVGMKVGLTVERRRWSRATDALISRMRAGADSDAGEEDVRG